METQDVTDHTVVLSYDQFVEPVQKDLFDIHYMAFFVLSCLNR